MDTQKERCQGIVLDQKERMCAKIEGKRSKKNSGDARRRRERDPGERWFECLAYSILVTLSLTFSASASAIASVSPMFLFQRLHG